MVAHGGHGVSAVYDKGYGPSGRLVSAYQNGVLAVGELFKIGRVENLLVCAGAVVALEIVADEDGHFAFALVGVIDQQQGFDGLSLAAEGELDLLLCGASAERLRVFLYDFVLYRNLLLRCVAVSVCGEEFQQFWPALFFPLLGGGYGCAVRCGEQMGKGVDGNLGLVIVLGFQWGCA